MNEWKRTALDNIVYKNPVLTHALGICTIVAAGTTLYNGFILSLLFAAVCIPTCIISSLFYRKLMRPYRSAAVVLTASVFYTLGVWGLTWVYGSISTLFRYYLPLMAVNSLMFNRAVRYAPRETVRETILDSATSAVGFSVAACLTGALRELLQNGAIAGWQIFHFKGELHMTQVPFFGFIALGFIAAAARAVRLRRDRRARRERSTER